MTLPLVGCLEQVKKSHLLWGENRFVRKTLARLKELRKFHRLTQETFSEKSGISYKYYQAIEGGRKPDLRLSTLERLAKAYRIELWQLFAPQFPAQVVLKLRKSARAAKRRIDQRQFDTTRQVF